MKITTDPSLIRVLAAFGEAQRANAPRGGAGTLERDPFRGDARTKKLEKAAAQRGDQEKFEELSLKQLKKPAFHREAPTAAADNKQVQPGQVLNIVV